MGKCRARRKDTTGQDARQVGVEPDPGTVATHRAEWQEVIALLVTSHQVA